jgi:hypothetical protein
MLALAWALLAKGRMRATWVFVLLAACTTTTTKPPPPCAYDNAGIADIEYRDPQTGQCQSFGYGCDPTCGAPCPETGATGVAQPDWGQCGGVCDGIGEAQCLANASCHAAYQDDSAAKPVFWGCWELPPSGAVTGACTNLDAQTCSEHTDCISLYTGPVNQPANFVPSFESCAAEPTNLCGGVTCAAGGECVVTPAMPSTAQCISVATAGSCTAPTCALPAPGCPTGTTPGVANGCYTNYCIPNSECAPAACSTLATEADCLARGDCDPIYVGSNCTCDRNGCTCQTETYQSCQ